MPDRKRSDIITLINAVVFNAVTTTVSSNPVACDLFKKFMLFLNVVSTLTPTTIQFRVEFSDDGGTTWFQYKQGLFASLFYEDQDTATPGLQECFDGEAGGRLFRLTAVATGTSAVNLFTVTARVAFYN